MSNWIGKVWVDGRAGSERLIDPLREHMAVGKTTLAFGDVSFTGWGPDEPVSVGIEYKKLSDFLSSLLDNRLMGHQIPGLVRLYPQRYLLIEGAFKPDPHGRLLVFAAGQWRPSRPPLPYARVQGAIWTLVHQCGVEVARTGSLLESVHWIKSTVNSWSKPWDKHQSHLVVYNPPAADERLMVDPDPVTLLALQVPGLGRVRAVAASEVFDTPQKAVNGSEGDWCQVEGVGRVLAKRVVCWFSGKTGSTEKHTRTK